MSGVGRGIGGGYPDTVEVGDKTIIVSHLKRHEIPASDVIGGDIERNANVAAGSVRHGVLDVHVDIGLVAATSLISDSVGSCPPPVVVEWFAPSLPSGSYIAGRRKNPDSLGLVQKDSSLKSLSSRRGSWIAPVHRVIDFLISSKRGAERNRSACGIGTTRPAGGWPRCELFVHPAQSCGEPILEVVDLSIVSTESWLV